MTKALRTAVVLALFTAGGLTTRGSFAQSKSFTVNADFDGGALGNVCHGPAPWLDCANAQLDPKAEAVADQLILGRTQVSKVGRVWVDNYIMGWIVGIDAKTGRQFARFDSASVTINGQPTGGQPSGKGAPQFQCDFASKGNCPGRVTTDSNGDVWIINRAFGKQGTLSKFSGSLGHCLDRNNNGIIDTSNDANGDGIVNPDDAAEYFGQNDECILATIPVGAPDMWPRGVAVDKKGKIWASLFKQGKIFRFNPNEPVTLETVVDLGDNVNPYSLATGKDYLFVSNRGTGGTKRVNIDTLEVDSAPCPGTTYGIVATPDGNRAYLGQLEAPGGIFKADFVEHTCVYTNTGDTNATAPTLDLDGKIWLSGYGNASLERLTDPGPPSAPLVKDFGVAAGGSNPHGLSPDFAGIIWSVTDGAPFIKAFNPDGSPAALPFTPSITAPGNYPYTPYLYSDFTGVQIDRQAPFTRLGSWSATYDSGVNAIPWSQVLWNQEPEGATPPETALAVSARAGDTPQALGQAAFVPAVSGAALAGVKGRYIEVKVDLSGPGYETPVLSDLTVKGPCEVLGEACCVTDSDCVSPDACTTGFCPTPGGACQAKAKPSCCLTNADCNDSDLCTTDTCPGPGKTCTHDKVADCCSSNSECDDGVACTADICSGPGGTCSSKPINGCCTVDADCDTKNKCLAFKCPVAGSLCELTPVAGCCNTDSDCSDADACTLDKCNVATGTCEKPTEIDGCCKTDADCNDNDPCTTDQCSGAGGKCKHKAVPECCTMASPEVGKPCDPPVSPNDKAPCKAGQTVCKNNKLGCEGALKPQPEQCDGIDNDCDGNADKGSDLCPTGKACSKGVCVLPCKSGEFPCTNGFVCDDGLCVPSDCSVVTCPAGSICKDAACVPDPSGAGGAAGAGGSSAGGAAGSAQGGASGSAQAGSAGSAGKSAGGSNGGSSAGGAAAGTSAAGSSAGGAAGKSSAGGSSAGGAAGAKATGGTAGGAAPGGDEAAASSEDKGGCGCVVPVGSDSSGSKAGLGLGLLVFAAALRRRRAS
jgi:MYXO-CTERM domain-containing protein